MLYNVVKIIDHGSTLAQKHSTKVSECCCCFYDLFSFIGLQIMDSELTVTITNIMKLHDNDIFFRNALQEEDIETLNLQLDECQKKLGDAEATSEGIKMKMEESAQEYKRIDDQIKEMSDGGDTLKASILTQSIIDIHFHTCTQCGNINIKILGASQICYPC